MQRYYIPYRSAPPQRSCGRMSPRQPLVDSRIHHDDIATGRNPEVLLAVFRSGVPLARFAHGRRGPAFSIQFTSKTSKTSYTSLRA